MNLSPFQQTRRCSAFRWLVVLCLVLVAIAATAQAVHYHADQLSGAASHCSLCLVMHSAAALAHSIELDFSFQTSAYLPISEDAQHPAIAEFALFSRPPPSV